MPTWQLLCKEGHSRFEILSVVHEHAMQILRIRRSSVFIDLQSVHVYMMMFSVHILPICSFFFYNKTVIKQFYMYVIYIENEE